MCLTHRLSHGLVYGGAVLHRAWLTGMFLLQSWLACQLAEQDIA